MKNKELKPCPFCGNEKLKVEGKNNNAGYNLGGVPMRYLTVSVRCNKCHSRGPAVGSAITCFIANDKRVPEHSLHEWELREIAVEKWNARSNTIPVGSGENYEVTHK